MAKKSKALKYKRPNLSFVEVAEKGFELGQLFELPIPDLREISPSFKPFAIAYIQSLYHLLSIFGQNQTAEGLIDAHEEVHRFCRNTLNGNPNSVDFHCRKGCSHCCYIRVALLPIEVVFVAKYLKDNLDEGKLNALTARINSYLTWWHAATIEEKMMISTLCPLNVDNICIAHKARPFSCVRYHSFDVDGCIKVYKEGLLPIHLQPAQETLLQQDGMHVELSNAILRSSQFFCESLKLDTRTVQFIPALKIALEQENLVEAFFNNEIPFDSAVHLDLNESDTKSFGKAMADSFIQF